MSLTFTLDKDVLRRQATASDPHLSAWVGANAGSGKTFVLSRRVIRLLLNGADPSKILCLTFTRAAAAEMSERVFAALANWTTASDADLRQEIETLTGRSVPSEELNKARTLFAQALETPGGLKIQTIHALCERLLHQFPVEANVAGHFEVLDGVGKQKILRQAQRDILMEADHNPGGQIAARLSEVIARTSDLGYQKMMRSFLKDQRKIMKWIAEAGGASGAIEALKRELGVGGNDTVAGLRDQMLDLPNFPISYLKGLSRELLASSVKFIAQGELASIILNDGSSEDRHQALMRFFFTRAGEAKKLSSIASKAIVKDFPDLEERLHKEQERLIELIDKAKAVVTIDATRALLALGVEVADRYAAHKASAGMMDFDDLIEKAASLLEQPDAAAWVHYKLDQGLDHILVDEAQDTSPRQWDVVKHLADEFFTGQSAREVNRTLFAVGDEKQSIYSFQGASPEKFDDMHRQFKKQAIQAEKQFEQVALSLSFRSTSDVLGAVDEVFQSDVLAGHLTSVYTPHTAARNNQPGFVELWQPFAKPPGTEHQGQWWQPLDHLGEASEKVQLAIRIAKKIREMIGDGGRLDATGEAITAGDILILTRKRGAQVDAINRALKAEGIAVAGSDRLKLMDNIAVIDLLSLVDFVLLSEDDLALAGLLKSPLIGMGEDDLFTLAHDRSGTLWNELFVRANKGETPYVNAFLELDKWRREADFVPPFDFFLRILSRDNKRQAFLGALGRETDEVLEAFLSEVITYEQNEAPTLQGFASWFRESVVEIKRDMDAARDEVRIMTVHGAKGLEAPIVFIVDGSMPYHPSHQPDILSLGEDGEGPFIWRQPKENKTEKQGQALADVHESTMAEYYRLLYVAMTRARDRLYVVTTANEEGQPIADGWFNTIQQSLVASEHCQELNNDVGEVQGWRWQINAQTTFMRQEDDEQQQETVHPPSWLFEAAPELKEEVSLLTPSRAGGEIDEIEWQADLDMGEDFEGVIASQRGTLMHRLLQYLPSIRKERRLPVALGYLQQELPNVTAMVVAAIAQECIAVLESPKTAFIFGEAGMRSEVPVSGKINLNGKVHLVRGEIDLLIVNDNTVYIVDFKTNRAVPQSVDQTPIAYRRQLALYRAVLQPVFPDKQITPILLWTKGTVLMPLDNQSLDAALGTLT